MNPVLKAALASLVRHLLTSIGSVLVAKGIWTEAEATEYLLPIAVLIVTVLWALIQKYATHLLLLDALDSPAGTDLRDLR
jgi:hypothetical protein